MLQHQILLQYWKSAIKIESSLKLIFKESRKNVEENLWHCSIVILSVTKGIKCYGHINQVLGIKLKCNAIKAVCYDSWHTWCWNVVDRTAVGGGTKLWTVEGRLPQALPVLSGSECLPPGDRISASARLKVGAIRPDSDLRWPGWTRRPSRSQALPASRKSLESWCRHWIADSWWSKHQVALQTNNPQRQIS